MGTIRRPTGQVNTWTFTANTSPTQVKATIYSNAARTVVVVAEQTLLPVVGFPQKFTGTIPNTLAAGTYYFTHQITTGAGTVPDTDDELIMEVISGGVTGSLDKVRRMVDETDLANTLYTDVQIQEYIDENTTAAKIDYLGTAAQIWEEKAGYYSALVDTTESGSSRKMSDLYKSAIAMAKLYRDKQTAALPKPVVKAVRPKVGSIKRG